MLAAFLGGWEIVILVVIAGGFGLLLAATLVVVLLANLKQLRTKKMPPVMAPSPQQPGQ